MTTDEGPKDANQPTFDDFFDYLAMIDHDDDGDSGVVHLLEDELIQEMIGIVEAGPTAEDIEHFAAVGQFISAVARIEKRVNSLGAYLLNPLPNHARPAMRALTARSSRELVKTLLVPRWPDARRLIVELETISEMRNKVAHNPISSYHLSDDLKEVVREYRLTYIKNTKKGAVPETILLPLELVEEWLARARVAVWVVGQVLSALAWATLNEVTADKTSTKMDFFFEEEAIVGETTGIGQPEIDIFHKYWTPLD